MSRKHTIQEINDKIRDKQICLVGEFTSLTDPTTFKCSEGHIFTSQPRHVIGGKFGCRECFVDNLRISGQEINDRIVHRGIQMTGEYYDTVTKVEFECICGYKWLATPRGILKGRGCHKCATHGFNPGRPGWIYILVFDEYIKYGITNNINQRLYSHKRKNGDYTVAMMKLHQDGQIAKQWENNIKIIFGGKHVTKDICPDGWTETLAVDKLNLLLETVK
jgi:hypothetical protein